MLLVDECFLALSGGDEDSLIHCIRSEALPAVVLRAFTKTFAIPGVRLGYAVCSAPTAERIRGNCRNGISPFSPSTPEQRPVEPPVIWRPRWR